MLFLLYLGYIFQKEKILISVRCVIKKQRNDI